MPLGATDIERVIRFARLHARPIALGGAGIVLVGAAGGWLALSNTGTRPLGFASLPEPSTTVTSSSSPSETPSASPTPMPTTCPLNGLPLGPAGLRSPVAISVQIDNHPEARPAHNLTRADMVIEATVEGDTTRFTPVFLCQPTEGLTGPVRSARYYIVDVWQDLHLLPSSFGSGGYVAQHLFRSAGLPIVDGISGAWPWYQRYGTAAAPHNLFADLEVFRAAFGSNARLDALVPRVGELRPQFEFVRDPALPTGRPVGSLEISTTSYWHFSWTWDLVQGLWLRSDAGVPIVDPATAERVSARSVVVQRVVESIDNSSHDPGGSPRRVLHLVGSGTGTLYVNGQAIDLRWTRATAEDGTHWTYAATGEQVVLPIGVYWWEIMPTYATFTER